MHPENPSPQTASRVVQAVRDALRREPRIGGGEASLALTFDDGTLTMEGLVADVAVKKLALECAAARPEVIGILDRLRTRPAREMDDDQVRELVIHALLQEPAFRDLALRERVGAEVSAVREPPIALAGVIEVAVDGGVVVLDGHVPGLEHKRLAGVLAWWVPGSRDVINGMAVEPDEEDTEGAIADAVRTALEKDPFVDAGQIRIDVDDAVVTLRGLVSGPDERDIAEFDAWYVFAVDRVVNLIDVETA